MLLDFFCIFSTGGLILWFKQFVGCKYESLINYIIKTILLDQKRTIDSLSMNGIVLRWKISDENNLVFIVAYQEAYSLLYVDKLLSLVQNDFIKNEVSKVSKEGSLYLDGHDYSKRFMDILTIWENDCNKILEGGESAKGVKESYNSNNKSKSIPKKKKNEEEKKTNSVENNETTGNDDMNSSSNITTSTGITKQSSTSNINSNIPKNLQLKKKASRGESQTQATPVETNKKPKKEKTQKQGFEYSKQAEKDLNM